MQQQLVDFFREVNPLTLFLIIQYSLSPILFKLFCKMFRYESGQAYDAYVNEHCGFGDRFLAFILFLLSPFLFFPLLVMLFIFVLIIVFPAFLRWMSDLPVSKNKMNQIINEFQGKKVVYSKQKVEIPVVQRPEAKK